MKKVVVFVWVAAFLMPGLVGVAVAKDLVFKKTKIVVIDGDKVHEKKAVVTWGEKEVEVKFTSNKDRAKYPEYEVTCTYDKMSELTYERSKHSRIASALLLSPFMLFSKRKHHWFSWNYVDENDKKHSMLLRVDKKEERLYRQQVPNITGLELEVIIED